MTYSMIYFGLFFFFHNAGFSNANSFPMRAGYNRFSVKIKSNQIKSNPLFRHVTPRSTKVLVKTCTCIQIRKLKIKKKIMLETYTLLL